MVPVRHYVAAVQTAAMAQTRARASAATPARKRALQPGRLSGPGQPLRLRAPG